MRPAFSIIFFTVMSGFGFGLVALEALNLIEMPEMSDKIWVLATIFIFAGAGLLSSTFHLGHPERAWRALTQWRSSWLSREGVLAIITLDAILGWFLYAHFVGTPPLWAGIAVSALCLATIFCTAMIYASCALWRVGTILDLCQLSGLWYCQRSCGSGRANIPDIRCLCRLGSRRKLLVGAWGVKMVCGKWLANHNKKAQEKQQQAWQFRVCAPVNATSYI